MTEAEWLTCDDPNEMWEVLPSIAANERKLRLFGVACCRGWDAFSDARLCRALDVAERHADGKAGEHELAAVDREVCDVTEEQWDVVIFADGGSLCDPIFALIGKAKFTTGYAAGVTDRISTIAENYDSRAFNGLEAEIRYEQCVLLRDIVGNPFRPVAFDPGWRTSTAVALARGMYESRDFGAMPILADALQDAGCDSGDVLDHCRGPEPHVRGCWVIDWLTGRE